jgi:phosphatidylserine decarboxylase
MRFAREAWPFVLPFVALAVLLWWSGAPRWAGPLAVVVAVLVLLFFRDPSRSFDGPPDLILAPANGRVTRVDTVEDPALGPGRWRRIVTFLSVFDVHVQQAPAAGTVVRSERTTGPKVAAFRPDADRLNESHLTVLRLADGDLVGVRQIAGLVARRVVCYLGEGQTVTRGQHLGIIKFGSRVDLLLPESYDILVSEGNRLTNGLTVVARRTSTPPAATP